MNLEDVENYSQPSPHFRQTKVSKVELFLCTYGFHMIYYMALFITEAKGTD